MVTSTLSRLGTSPEEGIKAPVKTISSGNEALFGIGQSIGGVVIVDNDRVAVAAQTVGSENGIYVARNGKSWIRATDFNANEDVVNGQLMVDANTSAVYAILAPDPWVPDTDTVTFSLLLSPSGFFWGAITGTLSNQADLQLELDAKSDTGHTHLEADVTDLQAYLLDAAGSIAMDGDFHARRNAAWEVIDFSIFAPTVHTHLEADITDLQAYILDAAGSIANDDLLYARLNGDWQAFSTASGNVGEIVAWPDDDVPDNFLDCNGQSVNAITFSQLFAIVGFKYGGSGANFNLPDLRGTFIRGTAGGSGNDPDRTSRTDRGDGATGDLVGTKQANSRASSGPIGHPSGSTGGQEDRPINVYMNYIIRYQGGGSGNLPPEVAVQNNGVEITTAVQLLNFINFVVTEPVTDQVDIAFGVSTATGIYNPGYTSYTQIDDDEFEIDGVNAVNLFYAGRRLRFTSDSGAFTFGNIDQRDFDSTVPNDTYVRMSMDSGETIPAIINTVELISSDTQWSPIPTDPFGGDSINDIVVGDIAGVTYLFAVGDLGKAGHSIDGGLTWIMLVTGTTEHLNVCTFDSVNEEFWSGGELGVLVSWDGTTVTLDAASIAALPTTGDARIQGFTFSSGEDALLLLYQHTNVPAFVKAYSLDQGATWIGISTLGNIPDGVHNLKAAINVGGSTGPQAYALLLSNTSSRRSDSAVDTSFATGDGMAPTVPSAMGFFDDGGQSARVYGGFDNAIRGEAFWTGTDVVTFANRHRAFAYSPVHDRLVVVGDNQQIGTLDKADQDAFDAWTISQNGFDPLANILGVEWDDTNGNFCAVADNGQICRSTNGLGDLIVPQVFTGWTLIAADPFSGQQINRIMSGSIGGDLFWVAIGSGGTLYTSIDAGITWTVRTTGTSLNLISIGYNSSDEQFFVGCASGAFLHSLDGITWTLDTTTIPPIFGGTGGDDITGCAWDPTASNWIISAAANVASNSSASADSAVITWTVRDPAHTFNGIGMIRKLVSQSDLVFPNAATDMSFFRGAQDITDQLYINKVTSSPFTCLGTAPGTNSNGDDVVAGNTDGELFGYGIANTPRQDPYSFSFSTRVNGIMFSTVSSRWIAVADGGLMRTMASSAFDTSDAWKEVINPFTANITDVWYDAADDIFIAVGSNGEIGRSTDGIS